MAPHSWHVNLSESRSSMVISAVKVSPVSMSLLRVPSTAAVYDLPQSRSHAFDPHASLEVQAPASVSLPVPAEIEFTCRLSTISAGTGRSARSRTDITAVGCRTNLGRAARPTVVFTARL